MPPARPNESHQITGAFIGRSGVAPGVPALGASLSWDWERQTHHRLVPAIGADLGVAVTRRGEFSEGSAAFGLYTIGLRSCLLDVWSVQRLTVHACMRGEAGLMRTDAATAVGSRERFRPWVAAGPSIRTQWAPFAQVPVLLSLELGAVVPFVRERFFLLSPTRTIHQVPFVVGYFALGLTVRN